MLRSNRMAKRCTASGPAAYHFDVPTCLLTSAAAFSIPSLHTAHSDVVLLLYASF
jgi:hypothetical protein